MNARELGLKDMGALATTMTACYTQVVYTEKQLRLWFEQTDYRLLGFFDDGKLIGFLIFHLTGDLLDAKDCSALPEYRAWEDAQKLYAIGREWALAHGCSRMRIEFCGEDSHSLHLYRKLGFHIQAQGVERQFGPGTRVEIVL